MYLPILLIALVAATLSIGGLLVVKSNSRAVQIRGEAAIARMNAASAIEIARAKIAADNNWRLTNVNGAWIIDEAVSSGGTLSVSVTNPFGTLSRSDSDTVIITGTGKMGNAVQTISVTLNPGTKTPLTCLDGAISVGGTLTMSQTKINSPSALTVCVNGDVVVTADVDFSEDLSVGGVVSGKTFKKTVTTGVTPRTFPVSSIFTASYPTATAISLSALGLSGTTPVIQACLLSPAVNPYGATNSRGIYSIDCGGGPLLIQNCRLVATLIVTNCSLLTINNAIVWEPAETTLPVLLVNGNLSMQYGNGGSNVLTEDGSGPTGSGIKVNFNPAGAPYPWSGGTTNTNTTDKPATIIDGLIYASGDATIAGQGAFHSLMVGGNLSIGNYPLAPTRDTRYYDAPPPGFYTTKASILQGTYR